MSTETLKKATRGELLSKLWDLGRVMSTQTVFIHQAIAQSFGLNATDTKCIDLILRGPADWVTAGWLADMTGLTTGAITHILDRLEKRAFIQRMRDPNDRRRVFIRVRPETLRPLTPKYEEMGKSYLQLAKQYGVEELRLICDYLEKTCQISDSELAKLRTANRERLPDATRSLPSGRKRSGKQRQLKRS